ncbi:hypothetical protein [Rugamonas sp. DEMB1]|uniref:hypothetical protein n=1 Tax=Rugamonas sp. DEMB1 TaxID=3039386 RepID=UPI0024498EB7|nr:hypothetical protein [Rugamonas sp. DEMB1]WGG51334.1 hypothetical protein QC826_03430 [Rugamonas sp. DEMB1]
MINRTLILMLSLICLALASTSAMAAKEYRINQYQIMGSNILLDPVSCDTINSMPIVKVSTTTPGTCEGLDSALKTGGSSFVFVSKDGRRYNVSIGSSGSCVAGPGPTYLIPTGYVSDATGKTVQMFTDPVGEKFSSKGCEMVITSEVMPISCVTGGGGNPPAGIHTASCYYESRITGANGGVDASPSTTADDYTGSSPYLFKWRY